MISKNISLRKERVKLVQQGKIKESRNKLREIWALKKPIVEIPKIVEVPKKELSFEETLCKIKGIGKQTAHDIFLIYKEKENLINAIKSGNELPLRNDVEEKLRNALNI